jgi:hypothetical protein
VIIKRNCSNSSRKGRETKMIKIIQKNYLLNRQGSSAYLIDPEDIARQESTDAS